MAAWQRGSRMAPQSNESSHEPSFSASCVAEAESLYRSGRTREAVEYIDDTKLSGCDPDAAVNLLTLRGMSLFDAGNAIRAIATLSDAVEMSRRCSSQRQFATAFALFVRESDFQAPVEVIPGLTRLRQLASLVGEAHSLTGLHLAVARLEGYRGHCVNAHRHLEIARRFTGEEPQVALRCAIDLVDASLESIVAPLGCGCVR